MFFPHEQSETKRSTTNIDLDPQWLTDLNLFWLLVFPTKKDEEPQKVKAFFSKEIEGLSRQSNRRRRHKTRLFSSASEKFFAEVRGAAARLAEKKMPLSDFLGCLGGLFIELFRALWVFLWVLVCF